MNLKKIMDNEEMIIPNYNEPNIVDLVKMLYSRYSVKVQENSNIQMLKNIIPKKKHTVFLLIDGMGSNLIDILEDSILKKNKIMDLLTVSPSSTGCVLTTLATATYPSEHGIIGWYSYDRKHKLNYYPLLFSKRETNTPLNELGIKVEDIFNFKSKLNTLNVHTTVLFPSSIYDSVFSNYTADKEIRKPYNNLDDAFTKIVDICSLNQETFTYLYIPDIDELEHDNGYDSKIVKDKIKEIELQITKLLKNDVLVLVTADHGQTNVSKDIVMNFEDYNDYFYALPGIDFGMVTYYIKKGKEEDFVRKFNSDYEGKMLLFKTSDFIENEVFGPNIDSSILLDSLGEYISLCRKNYQFINSKDITTYYGATKGNHSGLSKDEMTIPLIVIDKK